MQSHGPKRVYTPQSLEFWFDKLAGEWENSFTPSQLDAGRAMYRDGEVRELEITHSDAIVHRKVDKQDQYVVIEWVESGLQVRSSSTDEEVARALAVAGMHEIEELVADEISPLPELRSASSTLVRPSPAPEKPRVSAVSEPVKPAAAARGNGLAHAPAPAGLAAVAAAPANRVLTQVR